MGVGVSGGKPTVSATGTTYIEMKTGQVWSCPTSPLSPTSLSFLSFLSLYSSYIAGNINQINLKLSFFKEFISLYELKS